MIVVESEVISTILVIMQTVKKLAKDLTQESPFLHPRRVKAHFLPKILFWLHANVERDQSVNYEPSRIKML